MEKKNKIILAIIIIITVFVLGGCVYSVIKDKNNELSDAIKFRNEYMELNDKYIESLGVSYPSINISETNTIKYITEKEAVKFLEEGTGIIYFGFSGCPWCRSLIPILTKISEEKNETIYYLDILNIRSTFKVENSKLKKTREGTKEYYQILDILDAELEDFYLEDEEGNKYDTNEKRLYAPTVIAIRNGEVTGIQVSTLKSQKSGFDKLTDDQTKELEGIIKKLINSKTKTEVCTKDKC